MGSSAITLEGAKEMSARLTAIAQQVAGKVVDDAAFDSAEPLKNDMQEHTPVYLNRLKPGIDRQLRPREGENSVVWVGPTRRRFVARFLEFGTRKMSARPFIRPSLERSRTSVIARFNESIRSSIERIAGALS